MVHGPVVSFSFVLVQSFKCLCVTMCVCVLHINYTSPSCVDSPPGNHVLVLHLGSFRTCVVHIYTR